MSEKEALLPTKRIFCNQYSLSRCTNAQYRQTIWGVKCHLAHLQHSKTLEKHENQKLFELNVYFVRIFMILHF